MRREKYEKKSTTRKLILQKAITVKKTFYYKKCIFRIV